MLWIVAGAALVALALIDIFLVVLQYDSLGLLSNRLYRVVWVTGREATRPLPQRSRVFVRSVVAPFMIPMTVAMWMGMLVLGYALMYEPGVVSESFHFVPGIDHAFGAAFYFSAATISSLSFTDMYPVTQPYRLLASSETLIGLGALTMAITYVLNVYRVLQGQAVLATLLHHQAEDELDGTVLLVHHFVNGTPRAVDSFFREIHNALVPLHEGLRRYPILYYFQSRRPYRSIAYIFSMVGELIAAARWALPEGHPVSDDPWLASLQQGYLQILRDINEQFLHEPVHIADEEREGDDELVGDFLETVATVHAAAGLDAAALDVGVDDVRARYEEWAAWTAEVRAFTQGVARDLGNEALKDRRDRRDQPRMALSVSTDGAK